MDELQILRPFQQFFSHIRTMIDWLSLVVSVMVSFCAVLFPTRCLG